MSNCQDNCTAQFGLVLLIFFCRACARAKKSNKAMEIFRVVKVMGLELDAFCYTTAMNGKFQFDS